MEPEPARRLLERLVRRHALPKIARIVKTIPIPDADLSGLGIPGVTRLRAERLEMMPHGSGLRVGGDLVFE